MSIQSSSFYQNSSKNFVEPYEPPLVQQLSNCIKDGRNEIHELCIHPLSGEVINIKSLTYKGAPLLELAIHDGKGNIIEIIENLIGFGADPSEKSREGKSLLSLAFSFLDETIYDNCWDQYSFVKLLQLFARNQVQDIDPCAIGTDKCLSQISLEKGFGDIVAFYLFKMAESISEKGFHLFASKHGKYLNQALDALFDRKNIIEELLKRTSADQLLQHFLSDPITYENELSVVEALVDQGASVDTKSKEGMTPLFYAIKKSSIEVCEFLIDKGADSHKTDSEGRSSLDLMKMRVLEAEGSEEAAWKNLIKKTVVKSLSILIRQGQHENLKKTCQEYFGDSKDCLKDVTDDEGIPLLEIAIRCSNPSNEVIKTLIELGADINASIKGVNEKGYTLLGLAFSQILPSFGITFDNDHPSADWNRQHYWSEREFIKFLKMCKEANVDINPRIFFSKNANQKVSRLALKRRLSDVVKFYLKEEIKDVKDFKSSVETHDFIKDILYSHIFYDKTKILNILSKRGVDLSVLFLALLPKLGSPDDHYPVFKALIEKGINAKALSKMFLFAARSLSPQTCRLLIKKGTDPHKINKKGESPFDMMKERLKEKENEAEWQSLIDEIKAKEAPFVRELFSLIEQGNRDLLKHICLVERNKNSQFSLKEVKYFGYSLLELAIRKSPENHAPAVIETLIEFGADPKETIKGKGNSEGFSLFGLAYHHSTNSFPRRSWGKRMRQWTEQEFLKVLKVFDEKAGFSDESVDNGYWKMQISGSAIAEQQFEIAKFYLRKKLDSAKSIDSFFIHHHRFLYAFLTHKNSNKSELIAFLKENGISPTKLIGHFESPYSYGYANDRIELLKILIANGADVNVKDESGKTLLSRLTHFIIPEEGRLLIENGADLFEEFVDSEEKKKTTPLDIIQSRFEDLTEGVQAEWTKLIEEATKNAFTRPLFNFIKRGNAQEIKIYCQKHYGNSDNCLKGVSHAGVPLLELAIRCNEMTEERIEVIKTLIEFGVDPKGSITGDENEKCSMLDLAFNQIKSVNPPEKLKIEHEWSEQDFIKLLQIFKDVNVDICSKIASSSKNNKTIHWIALEKKLPEVTKFYLNELIEKNNSFFTRQYDDFYRDALYSDMFPNKDEIIDVFIQKNENPTSLLKAFLPLYRSGCSGVTSESSLLVFEAFVKHQVDLNTVDKYGCSLLYYAANSFSPQVCRFLIEHGADPHQVNQEKQSPFDLMNRRMEKKEGAAEEWLKLVEEIRSKENPIALRLLPFIVGGDIDELTRFCTDAKAENNNFSLEEIKYLGASLPELAIRHCPENTTASMLTALFHFGANPNHDIKSHGVEYGSGLLGLAYHRTKEPNEFPSFLGKAKRQWTEKEFLDVLDAFKEAKVEASAPNIKYSSDHVANIFQLAVREKRLEIAKHYLIESIAILKIKNEIFKSENINIRKVVSRGYDERWKDVSHFLDAVSDKKEIIELLKTNGITPTEILLHYHQERDDHLPTLQALVENGADIHAKDENDETVLFKRADGITPRDCDYFIDHGADLFEKFPSKESDKGYETPLDRIKACSSFEEAQKEWEVVIEKASRYASVKHLVQLIKDGKPEELKTYCLEQSFSHLKDVTYNGMSLLELAIRCDGLTDNRTKMIEILVDLGAYPRFGEEEDNTLLKLAFNQIKGVIPSVDLTMTNEWSEQDFLKLLTIFKTVDPSIIHTNSYIARDGFDARLPEVIKFCLNEFLDEKCELNLFKIRYMHYIAELLYSDIFADKNEILTLVKKKIPLQDLFIELFRTFEKRSAFSETREGIPILKAFVENNIDLNVKNAKGESLLFYAAKSPSPEIFRFLIKHGADPHQQLNKKHLSPFDLIQKREDAANAEWKTLVDEIKGMENPLAKDLSLRITEGDVEGLITTCELRKIVDKNFSIDNIKFEGYSLLELAMRHCPANARIRMLRALFQFGAIPNACIKGSEFSILALALYHVLEPQSFSKVRGKLKSEWTEEEFLGVLKVFEKENADLDPMELHFQERLHISSIALDYRKFEIAKFYLNKRSATLKKEHLDEFFVNHGDFLYKLLNGTSKMDEVIDMLENNGITPSQLLLNFIRSRDPFNHSNIETLQALIQKGANVNEKDKKGKTLLFKEASSLTPQECQYLLDHGANLFEEFPKEPIDQNTPAKKIESSLTGRYLWEQNEWKALIKKASPKGFVTSIWNFLTT